MVIIKIYKEFLMGACMAVSCECCVVPGRDLCDDDNSADDVDMFRMSEGG
jgi:hypothetical protein